MKNCRKNLQGGGVARWASRCLWNYDALHPKEDPHTPFEQGGGVARWASRCWWE